MAQIKVMSAASRPLWIQWGSDYVQKYDRVNCTHYDSTIGGYVNQYGYPQDYTVDSTDGSKMYAPDVSGYSFEGWYTIPSNGSYSDYPKMSDASTLVSTSTSITYSKISSSCKTATNWTGTYYVLYAKYRLADITVTFDPGDGGSVSPSRKTVTYGQQYGSLPTPTKTNARFVGWFTAQTGGYEITSTSIVSVTENQTLYAHWLYPTCVVFDPNGGDTLTGDPYKLIYEGDTFGTLPTTTRTSVDGIVYTFAGWFTAETGGVAIETSTVYQSSMGTRIYAHWNENTVTITFDADGGVVSPASSKYVQGSQYGSLPMPLKSGYTFQNWKLNQQVITPSSVVPDQDSTLVASYTLEQQSYTIRYTNPITGIYVDVAYNRDIQYNFPCVNEVFPGYSPPDGTKVDDASCWINATTGSVYGGGRQFINIGNAGDIVVVNINVVSKTILIVFNPNGGSVSPSSKEVKYGQPIGELPIPTKSGKYFNGWFSSLSGGNLILQSTLVTWPGSSVQVYASWRDANGICMNDIIVT